MDRPFDHCLPSEPYSSTHTLLPSVSLTALILALFSLLALFYLNIPFACLRFHLWCISSHILFSGSSHGIHGVNLSPWTLSLHWQLVLASIVAVTFWVKSGHGRNLNSTQDGLAVAILGNGQECGWSWVRRG